MAGKKARARKKMSERRDANAAVAGEAIPGLPHHSSSSLAYSDLSTLTIQQISHGSQRALQRRQRRGLLTSQELLCQAAAGSGQLEELKALRADDNPWDENTISFAAECGHLKVVLWACANGCPCGEKELRYAAEQCHEAVVRALIKVGADVNKANDNGATPLYLAAQLGNEAVLRAHVESGADVSKGTQGMMPLSVSMAPISNVLQGRHAADFQMLRSADFA